MSWRVGSKVPINVYEGDRPVCQCHTEEDAARIVMAMQLMSAKPTQKPPQIVGAYTLADSWTCAHFKLADGNSVNISLDKIRDMWNEEQRRLFAEKNKP